MPTHSHAAGTLSGSGSSTDSGGAHTHNISALGGEVSYGGTGGTNCWDTPDRANGQSTPNLWTAASAGAHTHTLSGLTISGNTATAGTGGTADDNRPPYAALGSWFIYAE